MRQSNPISDIKRMISCKIASLRRAQTAHFVRNDEMYCLWEPMGE
jgi:hypothetical protein